MLNELKVRLPASGARKCRLFAVACCRRIWDLIIDPRSRLAVDALERYAGGGLMIEEMAVLADEAQAVPWDHPEVSAINHAAEAAAMAVAWERDYQYRRMSQSRLGSVDHETPLAETNLITRIAGAAYHAAHARGSSIHPGRAGEAWLQAIRDEEAAQAGLIREIFGNAYRPIDFDPSWRTPEVVDLARGIGHSKDFDGMPALGDALEESGCDRAEILDHCREPGIHVPGCWVLDAVLGPWIKRIDGD
jgi:hypothetical protein